MKHLNLKWLHRYKLLNEGLIQIKCKRFWDEAKDIQTKTWYIS